MNEVPNTFCFMFEDGPVWEKDMNREQLLHVIRHLMADRDWWAAEARAPKYWWQQSDRGEKR